MRSAGIKTAFGINYGAAAKPKLCINCKHAHREVDTWLCLAPQQGSSLVTGLLFNKVGCARSRDNEDSCGPTAQWFEKGEEDAKS